MTLSLELGGIHDPATRRAFEQIRLAWPAPVTGGGGAETDPVASPALATHAALTTGAHGGIVASSDARLTDARTPTAHKTSHEPGGSDALTGLTNASIAAAAGIAKTKLASLDVVNADVNASAAIAETKLSLATDAAAGTGSRRTLGTTSTSAASGDRGLPTGGTSGQVLAKNSSTNYDTSWATPAGGAKVIGGRVSAATTPLIDAGTGFTVSRPATGQVRITITQPSFSLVSITALSAADTASFLNATWESATSVLVRTYTNAVVASNQAFHFVAFGT